jgi:hypothetical protein
MNPCPCGYYGDPRRACSCAPGAIGRYQKRESTGVQGKKRDHQPRASSLRSRVRRASVSSPCHDTRGTDPIDIAEVSPRRMSGTSQRASLQVLRCRKLAPDQVVTIRALAGTKSLRALATDFDVSHETIRAALRARATMTSGSCSRDAATSGTATPQPSSGMSSGCRRRRTITANGSGLS